MMLQFVWAITLYTFGPLDSTHTSCISPFPIIFISQISHSLVVILELSNVSEVQYKKIMIIGDE